MADEMKEITKYALMGGVGLTIGAPLLAAFGMSISWAATAIAVIGLIGGLTIKPSQNFLVASLVLSGISIGAATQLPAIGGFLQEVLKDMAILFGTFAIVPAIKIALKQFKIKLF